MIVSILLAMVIVIDTHAFTHDAISASEAIAIVVFNFLLVPICSQYAHMYKVYKIKKRIKENDILIKSFISK